MSCQKCGMVNDIGCSNVECPKLDVWKAATAPKVAPKKAEAKAEAKVEEPKPNRFSK